MSSRTRIEIVRSDAGQPWHARIVSSGRITFRTENYARKVGAERAVEALGRAFGVGCAAIEGEWLTIWLEWDELGSKTRIPLAYIDEREPAEGNATNGGEAVVVDG